MLQEIVDNKQRIAVLVDLGFSYIAQEKYYKGIESFVKIIPKRWLMVPLPIANVAIFIIVIMLGTLLGILSCLFVTLLIIVILVTLLLQAFRMRSHSSS